MILPNHDEYWRYTEEQLQEHRTVHPRHADREIVLAELQKWQKKRDDKEAEDREEKRQQATNRRFWIGVVISGLGVVLAFVFGVLPYLSSKRPPKLSPVDANLPQATIQSASIPPLATTPTTTVAPLPTTTTSPTATAQQSQSQPLSPTPAR